MVSEVLMPKLGATMSKGTIIAWMKNEGDRVEEGEPLLEIMSDKISIEVESPATGILLKKLYSNDDEVPVLATIAYIGDSHDEIPKATPIVNDKQPNETGIKLEEKSENKKEFNNYSKGIRRTPLARKLAKEYNIDLKNIKGSGPNNRIHKYDIEIFLKNNKKITPLAKKISLKNAIHIGEIKGTGINHKITKNDVSSNIETESQTVPYKGLRKAVGERMAKSWKEIPHVTLNTDIIMTNAIKLREQLLPIIEKQTNLRLSYSEIIIKAVAYTLKQHPMLNASLHDDEIKIYSTINIGFAVSVPNGLYVPVIENADQKGLAQLTEEAKYLTQLVRNNKITPDKIAGGTFTVSNLGMYAVNSFAPIINPGQTAILGIGKIEEKLMKVGDSIEAVPYMSVSLSFDHRVVDGAPAAEFLTDLKRIIENPFELLV